MFQVTKLIFRVTKHKFQVLKHKFRDLKHNFLLGKDTILSKQRYNFIEP